MVATSAGPQTLPQEEIVPPLLVYRQV